MTALATKKWTDLPDAIAALERLGACSAARRWLEALPDGTTWQQAWDRCDAGEWSLWLLGRMHGRAAFGSPERRRLAGCMAEVVISLASPFWTDAMRPACEKCVDLLIRYARGEAVTQDEFWEARRNAYAAAAAYDADAYAAAAYAAAAAYDADAYAAAAAAYAAAAAAYAAAYAADADATRRASLAASADIVRAHYPVAPTLAEMRA